MRRVPIRVAVVSPLLLFVGNTTSFAQATDQEAVSSPYKIALFPCEGNVGYQHYGDRKGNIASILRAGATSNASFLLAYSYYDAALNHPPITQPDNVSVFTLKALQAGRAL